MSYQLIEAALWNLMNASFCFKTGPKHPSFKHFILKNWSTSFLAKIYFSCRALFLECTQCNNTFLPLLNFNCYAFAYSQACWILFFFCIFLTFLSSSMWNFLMLSVNFSVAFCVFSFARSYAERFSVMICSFSRAFAPFSCFALLSCSARSWSCFKQCRSWCFVNPIFILAKLCC